MLCGKRPKKNRPRRKRSGGLFFGSTVEDPPAVEFAVLDLAHDLEIFTAVVESVIVSMVNFHGRWTVHDKPVHTYRVGFAVDDLSGNDVDRT